jgi:Protein of unknown function, DUF547
MCCFTAAADECDVTIISSPFIVFCTTSTLCKAFGVTLYNLMLKYAHLKLGQAPFGNKAAQTAFFALIKFDVGGHLFSFNDWEHGILRGNVKSKTDAPHRLIARIPDTSLL